MNYIVLDLEWNQPFSSKNAIKTPVFLKGEIVQIGAVKLNENFDPIGTFKVTVCPRFYTKMHYAVAKLTHITNKDLKSGMRFVEAMRQFEIWCGSEYVYLTWGYDDIPMLKDNMKVNGMSVESVPHFYNVQTIFDDQILKEHRQCSLSFALEKLGETIENAHDAFSDAYGTAIVCKHLDMARGIEKYSEIELNPNKYEKYPSVIAARSDKKVTTVSCPNCSSDVECVGWVVMKTESQMALASCRCGGKYLVRYRFRKNPDKTVRVGKAVYPLDDVNREMYELKKVECFGKTRHFNYTMKKGQMPYVKHRPKWNRKQ
jgi:inhibitor of KinA sporulation pathway (predicted exonuclease)